MAVVQPNDVTIIRAPAGKTKSTETQKMKSPLSHIRSHQSRLKKCTACPEMFGPPVIGEALVSPLMLIGQAPGDKEIVVHRPFAWTAGKTLFRWFEQIGMDEDHFRQQVYMAAVCRCFPGKNPKGGDRVPGKDEIENCSRWLKKEVELLQPKLVIPVGKLAIAQLMPVNKLVDIVGKKHRCRVFGHDTDVIPLPHPSGASTWHRTKPGKPLLDKALRLIARHQAWKQIQQG